MLEQAALAVLIGWLAWALGGMALSPVPATALGAAIGLGAVTVFAGTLPIAALIALLAPFGVMLPALALRQVGAHLGLPVAPFSTLELAAFLVAYLVFLAAAMGAVPVDLYRFGYAPLPVALMTLAVCAYGFATGNLFLPLVAVAGQLAWALGWGSSNWFDHVLHVLLIPIVLTILAQRLI
ncbi:hypothetical protein D6850_12590 [Roseovarius spongiae]|uniref:Uncharacterized protein n=1 Tax=Roseovarius spongiae TaxID=2320272 RepID=A0A3A8AS93_9RHOB|nr:hypothetical protein D6850_12590 [Roseovarius spongiae]